jgi:DmsE family decaheme c-type cytochrome
MSFTEKYVKLIQTSLAVLMLFVLMPPLLGGVQDAEYVGSQLCADCHDELSTQFTRSMHAQLATFELEGNIPGCESCHGPGSNHAMSTDPADIFNYRDSSIEDMNGSCLPCHAKRVGMYWPFAEHGLNGVTCIDCHQIHQDRPSLPEGPGPIERVSLMPSHDRVTPPRRASLKKPEVALCADCHKDVVAKTMLPSRHPVREGKMSCSSCHNVHGSEAGMIHSVERTYDLCVSCHAEKQGPFVFDHPPVTEDCSACHTPHGAVADNLLKQNEPFLCLQCHEAHFHIGREGISTPIDRETGTVSNRFGASGWRIAFGTKCTQCHQAVHGSDLPSQSVPSQGKGLIR